ncbi:hypothetical protein BH11VER1_BH11VER1_39300 [soil metagenome]
MTALNITLFVLQLGSAGFGWIQNRDILVGGPMSLPKILWLNLALTSFLVIPAFLWPAPSITREAHLLYGFFFAGFALRAIIEMPMLYFHRTWKCRYGITHDVFMMAVVVILGWQMLNAGSSLPAMRLALEFAIFLLVMLVCEILNAVLFSRIANPAEGIYFASDGAAFRLINRITWIEIALLYPWLGWWLVRWNSATSHGL